MGRPSVRIGVRLIGNPTGNRVVTCADVRACLEGDYSTWAEKWNLSVTEINVNVNRVIINVDGDVVCFASDDCVYLIKLSNGTLLTELADEVARYGYTNEYVVGSIRGKYLIITDIDFETIYIYKDGILKQSIIPISGDVIRGVGVSSDGKYVVVGLSDANKVYCYEGS